MEYYNNDDVQYCTVDEGKGGSTEREKLNLLHALECGIQICQLCFLMYTFVHLDWATLAWMKGKKEVAALC